MLPLVGVITHIVDQNNTKALKNIGVKNGYVLHLSILNHPFNSLENLCSRYEGPFTAPRKKNVLRPLGESIPGRGAEIWVGTRAPLGRAGSTTESHSQNTSPASCMAGDFGGFFLFKTRLQAKIIKYSDLF